MAPESPPPNQNAPVYGSFSPGQMLPAKTTSTAPLAPAQAPAGDAVAGASTKNDESPANRLPDPNDGEQPNAAAAAVARAAVKSAAPIALKSAPARQMVNSWPTKSTTTATSTPVQDRGPPVDLAPPPPGPPPAREPVLPVDREPVLPVDRERVPPVDRERVPPVDREPVPPVDLPDGGPVPPPSPTAPHAERALSGDLEDANPREKQKQPRSDDEQAEADDEPEDPPPASPASSKKKKNNTSPAAKKKANEKRKAKRKDKGGAAKYKRPDGLVPSDDDESHDGSEDDDEYAEGPNFDAVPHTAEALLANLQGVIEELEYAERGETDSRPTAEQIHALSLVHDQVGMLLEYACAKLGFGWERAMRNLVDMVPARGGNKYNLFKTFLRCTDKDYEPRRRFDERFGCKPTYTNAEYTKFYAELQKELGQQELDELLLAFDVRFPYGNTDPTTGDRESSFKGSTGRLEGLFRYLCAKYGFEGFFAMTGGDPALDAGRKMTKVFRTWHVRGFTEEKLFMKEAELPTYLQAHVFDSVANTRRAEALVAQGGKLPLFVSLNDRLPTAKPARSLAVGPGRRRGRGQEDIKINATYFQPLGADCEFRWRDEDVSPDDVPLLVCHDNTIYLAQIPWPEDAEGMLCPGNTVTVRLTPGEWKAAQIIWRNLFSKWFTLPSKGFQVQKAMEGVQKYGLTVEGWNPWVYIWNEARKRTTVDSMGAPMKCNFAWSLLNGQVTVCENKEIPKEYLDTFPTMPETPTRVLVITDSIPKLPSVPRCYWGTCRAYLDNGMVLGMHTSLLAKAQPPWGPAPDQSAWQGLDAWNEERAAAGLSTVDDDDEWNEEDELDDEDGGHSGDSSEGEGKKSAGKGKAKRVDKGKGKASDSAKGKSKRKGAVSEAEDDEAVRPKSKPKTKPKRVSAKVAAADEDEPVASTSKATGNGKRKRADGDDSDVAGNNPVKRPVKRRRASQKGDDVEEERPVRKKPARAPKSAPTVESSDDEQRKVQRNKLAAAMRKASSSNPHPHAPPLRGRGRQYDDNFEDDQAQTVVPQPPANVREPPENDVERAPPAKDVERAPPAKDVERAPPAKDIERAPPAKDVERAPPAKDIERAPPANDFTWPVPAPKTRAVPLVEEFVSDSEPDRQRLAAEADKAADADERAAHSGRRKGQDAPVSPPNEVESNVDRRPRTPHKTSRDANQGPFTPKKIMFELGAKASRNSGAERSERPSPDKSVHNEADARRRSPRKPALQGDNDDNNEPGPSHRPGRSEGNDGGTPKRMEARERKAKVVGWLDKLGGLDGPEEEEEADDQGDDDLFGDEDESVHAQRLRELIQRNSSDEDEDDIENGLAADGEDDEDDPAPRKTRGGSRAVRAAVGKHSGKPSDGGAPAPTSAKGASKGKAPALPPKNQRKRALADDDDDAEEEEVEPKPKRKATRDPKYSKFKYAKEIPSDPDYDFLFKKRTILYQGDDELARIQRNKVAFVCPPAFKTNEVVLRALREAFAGSRLKNVEKAVLQYVYDTWHPDKAMPYTIKNAFNGNVVFAKEK